MAFKRRLFLCLITLGVGLSVIGLQGPLAWAQQSVNKQLKAEPAAQLVSSFFEESIKIIFPDAQYNDNQTPILGIRGTLDHFIDADGIAHFILGRYGREASATTTRPSDSLLDFAAASLMRLKPHQQTSQKVSQPGQPARPQLTILSMSPKPDQTTSLQSILTMSDGRRLPLTWEVTEKPTGLRIEDVSCLGISVKLMLRSAVAEAAAEQPEGPHDLSHLLKVDRAFPHLPGTTSDPN